MKEIVLEGKTAEEAIEEGLKQLGVTREQVQVEILDEGKKGMFGLGGKMALVKLTRTEDNTERAAQIARDILERMGIEAEVSGEKVEDEIVIRISGAGGVLIGRRGQTLFSFQYLLTRILNQARRNGTKSLWTSRAIASGAKNK
jgi:spoIIIJ-associated protein